MDELEATDLEELIRRHAPELGPQSDPAIRTIFGTLVGLLTGTMVLVGLATTGVGGALLSVSLLATGTTAGLLTAWVMRRNHEENVAKFSLALRESPWRFYDALATRFAAEVERQRTRTIGSTSEWGRARGSLESAMQEAERSVAYWTQRLAKEPDDLAKTQLEAATRLRDKFQSALVELDHRARVLVGFFNDCEARVAVLQSAKRDFEEIRKLEALADKSDVVVARAEETLLSIGRSFVSEALRVGSALGGLERVGLVNLAGEAPLDRLEAFAERIVESAERDRSALERVAADLAR